MYNATSISYGGVTSESLGAIYCKVDNSSNEDVYVSNREIKSDTSGRNWGSKSKNYLYKVARQNRTFTIELGFLVLTDDIARTVSKVFFQDKFLPLIPNDTNRIYYCMPKSSKIRYLNNGGYITFEMETLDEFAYASAQTVLNKDYTDNVSTTFVLTVLGDCSIFPIVSMKFLGATGSEITLTNVTNGNQYMKFGTFTDENGIAYPMGTQEILTIDCDKEIITTNQPGIKPRYDNMLSASDFLELKSGANTIKVDGSTLLTFTYINKYLF